MWNLGPWARNEYEALTGIENFYSNDWLFGLRVWFLNSADCAGFKDSSLSGAEIKLSSIIDLMC